MLLPLFLGLAIVALVLWEAFETIVLPRRVARRWRLVVLFYRATWLPWRGLARGALSGRARETFLSFFGPLSLLLLFAAWAAALVLGFGLLLYGASAAASTETPSLRGCLYLSGTTLFTLGLGDVAPASSAQRFLAVVESGLGFGFLALVLSYLPVIYQAFSRREVNVVLLDARAGSPPTAGELLRRHAGPGGRDALEDVLRDWERAAADVLESHVSYPVLAYFRSQHDNESWLAGLATVLDTSALLVATGTDDCSRQARLSFAICRHAVVDLAQVFRLPPHRTDDRLPRADFERLRLLMGEIGCAADAADDTANPLDPASDLAFDDPAWTRLASLREMYEPYLAALSQFLAVEIPPWIAARAITDNWRTTAWGRIAGFAAGTREAADDHSD